MDNEQANLWLIKDEEGYERPVTREDFLRTGSALRKALRFRCKDEFDASVDKDADLAPLEGVGPVYGQIAPAFHDMSPAIWEDLTGTPVHCDGGDAEGALQSPPQKG